MPVKTGRFNTQMGNGNLNIDSLADGTYSVTTNAILDAGVHIVRVIASGGITLQNTAREYRIGGGVALPPQYEFRVLHQKVGSSSPARAIWRDASVLDSHTMALADGLDVPAGLSVTADVVTTFHADFWKCDTPRSDGSLLIGSEMHEYTLSLVVERLPILVGSGHLTVTSYAALSIIYEFNSLFP